MGTLGLAALAILVAQEPNLPAIADTVFQRWNSTHTPGCAVGVGRNGRVLLTRGYGMADLETRTPITAQTILESGSVAKQFTAAAVLLLAQDGKLSLDDPVRKYIPELPEYDKPITIRHLLTHTSGLREWSSLVALQGWPRGVRAHNQADLLDVIFRQRSLNYPVGEYYSYTNSGYALALTVIERVSGMGFAEFTRQRIFQPLGMHHTGWRDDHTRIVPGRAKAYSQEDDGWHLTMPYENVVGPGGMLTTAGDWLIWNQALANRTLGAALVDSLTRRMRLNNGREISYARGLSIGEYRGVAEISHSGSTAGYSTFLTRFPDRGNLSIAVLCNASNAAATSYARQLADRLITDFPARPAAQGSPADSAAFARYTGIYRNQRMHAPLQVGADAAPRFRALPDGSYLAGNGSRWRFETGANGSPTRLWIMQPDGDTVPLTFVARERWRPTARELEAFTGSYRSDELGVTYQARVAGDTLTVSVRAGTDIRLQPSYPDAFTVGGRTVWVSRDRRGRVTAMHVSESRVWDLVLRKEP